MGKSSVDGRRGNSPFRTQCGFLNQFEPWWSRKGAAETLSLGDHLGRHTGNSSEDKPQTAVSGGFQQLVCSRAVDATLTGLANPCVVFYPGRRCTGPGLWDATPSALKRSIQQRFELRASFGILASSLALRRLRLQCRLDFRKQVLHFERLRDVGGDASRDGEVALLLRFVGGHHDDRRSTRLAAQAVEHC